MFERRWYQLEAREALYDYFKTFRDGNPIVAMPTGTGKGIVIADFIHHACITYSSTRVLQVVDDARLVEQNYEELIGIWPVAPAGVCCAGVKKYRKSTHLPIIFGSIGTVINVVEQIGWRDLLIIDECHMVSDNAATQYQKLIEKLKHINPRLRVIGLSATPWRQGLGKLTSGSIFTHTCYDITGVEAFNRLIDEGFMKPVFPKQTRTEIDTSSVKIVNGEYVQSELAKAANKEKITREAISELLEYATECRAWLIFATDIAHAESINNVLTEYGVDSAVVHSKLSAKQNRETIKLFKQGKLRCIVNKDMLTTGFNYPPIDLIGMFRPTMSTGLWVQMLGRGTRPAKGVRGCLVLDFAGNAESLGPINDPVIPRRKGAGGGDMPLKICEACGTYNHISARVCIDCQEPFDIQHKLISSASIAPLLVTNEQARDVVEWVTVTRLLFSKHEKEGLPPSLKATYCCGLSTYNEWHSLERTGFVGKKARNWWRRLAGSEPPVTTDEALKMVSYLRTPTQIKVWLNKKPYPEILDYKFI